MLVGRSKSESDVAGPRRPHESVAGEPRHLSVSNAWRTYDVDADSEEAVTNVFGGGGLGK